MATSHNHELIAISTELKQYLDEIKPFKTISYNELLEALLLPDPYQKTSHPEVKKILPPINELPKPNKNVVKNTK